MALQDSGRLSSCPKASPAAKRRLPLIKTDDHVRGVKMLEDDIAEMGGEAAILGTAAPYRGREDKGRRTLQGRSR
jgi:hypothetical protein